MGLRLDDGPVDDSLQVGLARIQTFPVVGTHQVPIRIDGGKIISLGVAAIHIVVPNR